MQIPTHFFSNGPRQFIQLFPWYYFRKQFITVSSVEYFESCRTMQSILLMLNVFFQIVRFWEHHTKSRFFHLTTTNASEVHQTEGAFQPTQTNRFLISLLLFHFTSFISGFSRFRCCMHHMSGNASYKNGFWYLQLHVNFAKPIESVLFF